LRSLIDQTGRVFGVPHYAHYDALVALSDQLSAGGIEHLESAEDNLPADYFTHPGQQLDNRDLIAHEYVHSWNGRFRQPADLWTPTLNEPMRDSLLWVYEGQTEFWGRVLAARSGMRSTQETLDKLALDAAVVAARPGRSWKSLADSSLDPLFVIGHPVSWRDWQRREDYYPEGVMLWLYVDAMIREKSGGHKSLDDFAQAFFAIDNGSRITKTYTFEDVCAALNSVTPFDWATFLRARLNSQKADVLDGLARDGWRLTFTDTPTETFRQDELDAGVSNLSYSIGFAVTKNGDVRTVAWHGPAFDAGLAPGDRIQSINGKPFAPATLEAAVRASANVPIELGFEADGRSVSARIPYRGSLRYPRLERIAGSRDRIAALLAPRHQVDQTRRIETAR
jgi:predicted metalloprotease with PDZ domain